MYVEPRWLTRPVWMSPRWIARPTPASISTSIPAAAGRRTIPSLPDQTSWSVYGKLYEDNLNYLRGILEQASTAKDRDAVTQKIGDYYAACMDEAAVEKLGAKPMQAAPGRDPGTVQNVRESGAAGGSPASGRRDHVVRQRLAAGPGQLRRDDCRTGSGRPGTSRSRLLHQGRSPNRKRFASATCNMCRRCSSCWATRRGTRRKRPTP